jgi:MEDS: MEthanogen/methylotroph, DcmR Sensory domain
MATTSKKIHPSQPSESTIRKDEFKHLVQFCESDEFLIEVLSNYISVGLRNGDACIVIATELHRESLEEQLKQSGLEIDTFHDQGLFISIDAASTLSKFMVNGSPDPNLFTQLMGNLIMQTANGRHHLRIFGELVHVGRKPSIV